MSPFIHTRVQKLRQFPPGRAHQAASNVERVAFPLGYAVLAPFTRAVRDAARHYVALRTRRFGERTARGDGDAARIDRKADIRVAFIYDALRRYATDLADTDDGRLAAELLRRYFPRGLGAVTNAPYEEELIQLEAIVEGLTGDDAGAAQRLTITHHVAALEPLVAQYARALDQRARVTPDALKAAWQAVHHRTLELAFAVFTHVRDPEHREPILGPIFEQDDRLAAVYAARARGTGVSVDLDAEAEALAEVDDGLEDELDAELDAALDAEQTLPPAADDDIPLDDDPLDAEAADAPADSPLRPLPGDR